MTLLRGGMFGGSTSLTGNDRRRLALVIGAPIGAVTLIYLGSILRAPPVDPALPTRAGGEKTAENSASDKPRKPPTENFAFIKPLRPPAPPAPRDVAKAPASPPPSCPASDPASGIFTVAAEETPIVLSPSSAAKPLRDRSGGQRFLDPRHDLKLLETHGGWIRTEVVSPPWPPGGAGWSGWVEKKAIQRIDLPDATDCLFVDPTKWTGVSPQTQSIVREAGLRILHEDMRCQRISSGGYLAGGQRFYLTCYPSDGGRPYHYWLSPYNIPKTFALPPLIDEDAAIAQCRGKLDKNLAGQAIMKQAESARIDIEAFENRPSTSAHYLALDYRTGAGEAHRAYCIVPRGGEAEITLDAE